MSDISTSIRVERKTIDMLQGLKPSYEKVYPEKFISNDLILSELILEHARNNDPRFIEGKEQELLKDYVCKVDFDDIFNKKLELEDSLKKLEKDNVDLTLINENHQNNINNLNNELLDKKKEIQMLKKKNNEQEEKNINLNLNLKTLQENYDKCRSDYNDLKESVNQECIIQQHLRLMSLISKFLYRNRSILFRNKPSKYTIDELEDWILKEVRIPYEELKDFNIKNAVRLYKYFPVECIEQDGVHYFYFNKNW